MKLGSHVSMSGKKMLMGSVEEALHYDANTFMIYTGAPQNTRRKSIDRLRIEEARDLMVDNGIDPSDVVVHAPYIINLANPDKDKRSFAVDFLTEEIIRADAIGAQDIVLHPGSHVKEGVDTGIAYVSESLDEVFARTEDLSIRIALETMSGKGTELGRSFEELRRIIDHVEASHRLSVCFDTCHAHDAGYDVHDFDALMRHFDDIIGLERLRVFHLNDSKNPRGANKDRHANLGEGYIGFDTIARIVHHSDYEAIPKILETPYVTASDDSKKRVYPPYKEEIEMLKANAYTPGLIERIRRNHAG